jgi:hypothetical protein
MSMYDEMIQDYLRVVPKTRGGQPLTQDLPKNILRNEQPSRGNCIPITQLDQQQQHVFQSE